MTKIQKHLSGPIIMKDKKALKITKKAQNCKRIFFKLICLFGLLAGLTACDNNPKKDLFEIVSSGHSGIEFKNTITENDSINPKDCLNCFNGGGVGIGDFNNDGLPDIVFTGNQVSSTLYLNKGKLAFEDISQKAGFTTNSWVTGVSIVDINADGLDDIYLSVAGLNCENNCYNQLFINQGLDQNGIPAFKDEARAYGLEDGNYATQSVFFDYDLDGDLDVYIVHNKNNIKANRNFPRPKNVWPEFLKDYLLRNDSVAGVDHPVFVNVSEEVNLTGKGFGLGVGLADFNNDQLVDLYVSNDFITEDFLYINRAHHDSIHPEFEESNKQYLGHITLNGMGMDIADINNDGMSDIFVLDMFPRNYYDQKKVQVPMRFADHMNVRNNGYSIQYMRNTLQISNGYINSEPVKSSEVAFLYGISGTDWSWGPLILDFDNDGDKDIYVSNGYIKNVIDRDYIEFTSQKTSVLSKNNLKDQYLDELASIKEPNFFFEQMQEGAFKDVSAIWSEAVPSLSNGVAYGDLDLDGDLDLVVSNLNETAFLLENKTTKQLENHHYLRISLKGEATNKSAIGAKVTIWNNGQKQFHFQSVIRGYLSSVEPIVHFGLQNDIVDSLQVIWPDGMQSSLKQVKADQLIEIAYKDAVKRQQIKKPASYLFKSNDSILKYTHRENQLIEFADQQLLMRQYSRIGPCLAAGDLNGQPGDEIYIGGINGEPGMIWFQDPDGKYYPKQKLDSIYEDSYAEFLDIDNDNDLDLYVGSGGTEFNKNAFKYLDRLYVNDGQGGFTYAPTALPKVYESTGCVTAVDFDHDNDLDLFIGARITPGAYPNIPQSYMLINDNGVYTKMETEELSDLGMVTDADWKDIDGDGWEDLLVVGEFMPVTIFQNDKGSLKPYPSEWLDEHDSNITTEGWWNSIEVLDADQDGDLDFVVGNQGLNGYVKPEKNYPVHLYKGDFNADGSPDPLLGQYAEFDGEMRLFPVHTKEDIKKQYPQTVIHFYSFEDFAKIDFRGLLNIKDLDTETLKATTFASSYIENLGNGTFKLHPLPWPLQVSPLNDFHVDDFDGDGQKDILIVGNDFTAESNYGQFDALTGLLLNTDGKEFTVVPSRESGFYVPGQSNNVIGITDNRGRKLILAGQNDDVLKVFEVREQ